MSHHPRYHLGFQSCSTSHITSYNRSMTSARIAIHLRLYTLPCPELFYSCISFDSNPVNSNEVEEGFVKKKNSSGSSRMNRLSL